MQNGASKARVRRWWPVPLLVGLGLVVAVLIASASTATPQATELRLKQLSTTDWFAAYPDVAVGENGLVAAVWTEGPDESAKQNGPLQLAWTSNSVSGWMTTTVDERQVYDTAIAVSGSTVHIVWSYNKTAIYHTSCSPPDYACSRLGETPVTSVGPDETALQVDIVIDDNEIPHVVWVEKRIVQEKETKKVYYSRKEAGNWQPIASNDNYTAVQGVAIAYANNLIHLALTDWQNPDHTDSVVEYCRRGVGAGVWTTYPTPLADWDTDDYRARNPSIAAGGTNVYVAWDHLSIEDKDFEGVWQERKYVIGYAYSDDSGSSWTDPRTYPIGSESGTAGSGAEVFRSVEGQDKEEYVQFLRPHISLAVSGTALVPVLSWHAEREISGGEGEGGGEIAYKVLWDYAAQPGSDGDGNLFWATDLITLSATYCGNIDMSVDSATARVAVVGDLNEVLAGESLGNHLHAVYHERRAVGSNFWRVFYNNSARGECFFAYLPLMAKNAEGGSGGE